jgi:hypothetical protein
MSRSANGIVQPVCRASASIFAASWAIALGERFHRDRCVNGVQIRPPLCRLLRGSGVVQAVFQFDDGNGGEHDFGFSVLVFEYRQQFTDRLGVSLGGDQHPGVED